MQTFFVKIFTKKVYKLFLAKSFQMSSVSICASMESSVLAIELSI